jgi:hypothetical protein
LEDLVIDWMILLKCIPQLLEFYAVWQFVNDVSGKPIGTIFKGQVAQVLNCLILVGGTETSLTNYQSTLRKIPEERRSHLHCGGGLKSRIYLRNCMEVWGVDSSGSG